MTFTQRNCEGFPKGCYLPYWGTELSIKARTYTFLTKVALFPHRIVWVALFPHNLGLNQEGELSRSLNISAEATESFFMLSSFILTKKALESYFKLSAAQVALFYHSFWVAHLPHGFGQVAHLPHSLGVDKEANYLDFSCH